MISERIRLILNIIPERPSQISRIQTIFDWTGEISEVFVVGTSVSSKPVSKHSVSSKHLLVIGSLSKLTRRRPTCKFPFRRTQGQVNSVGP